MENLWIKLAWLLPRRLVYWASIRLISAATVDKYADTQPGELRVTDALKRWDEC